MLESVLSALNRFWCACDPREGETKGERYAPPVAALVVVLASLVHGFSEDLSVSGLSGGLLEALAILVIAVGVVLFDKYAPDA